jgi:hypothetical protein
MSELNAVGITIKTDDRTDACPATPLTLCYRVDG